MNITAKLSNVVFRVVNDAGLIALGRVSEDIKGRFGDGVSIHTSLIKEVVQVDGVFYLFTLNSTYEVTSFNQEVYRDGRF